MGLIKRQGLKSSIINYFGVIIGIVGTIFVYPLDKDTYGQIQAWIANGTILIPFLSFGSTTLITKFYSRFQKEYKNGFGTYILKLTGIGLFFGSILVYLIYSLHSSFPEDYQFNFFKSKNIFHGVIIAILIILSSYFKLLSSIKLRIVIPEIINNIGIKIVIIGVVLFSYNVGISIESLFYILCLYYLLNIAISFSYTFKLDKTLFHSFSLKKINNNFKSDIKSFWIFTGLNIFGSLLIYNIDIVMIEEYLGSTSVTNYSAFLMMANIITIPSRSFQNITAPVISKAMQNSNYEEVKEYYLSLSCNLLIFGIFCMGVLWINMDNILSIMTNGETYEAYKWCFVFLGISKLIELSTSVNHQIITFSKWYKLNLPLLFFSAIANITTNIVFIKTYGILGIAIGTSITILLYNIVKTIIVFKLIKTQPFQTKMIPPVIILITFISMPIITLDLHFVLSGILKTTIFSLIYLSILYSFKSSNIINDFVNKRIDKIKS